MEGIDAERRGSDASPQRLPVIGPLGRAIAEARLLGLGVRVVKCGHRIIEAGPCAAVAPGTVELVHGTEQP